MRRTVILLAAFVSLGLWIGNARLGAQEQKPEKPKPEKPTEPSHTHPHEGEHAHGEQEGPPEMTPVPVGPEHKRLQEFAGTWKIEHKMWNAPDGEPVISTGTEVITSILDGRAALADYEATGPEGPFKGHGLTTWNVMQKKYQGYWVDIFSRNGADESWGTYDEANKVWNWQSEPIGPDGKPMKTRATDKLIDKNRKVMEYFVIGPDGKEFKMMEMTSTRSK